MFRGADSARGHPPGYAAGLLAAIALVSVMSLGGDRSAAAPTGIFFGLFAGISGFGRGDVARNVYGVLGVLGSLAAIVGYLQATPCDDPDVPYSVTIVLRIASLAIVVLVLGATAVVGTAATARTPSVGLAWFGVIETLTFATTPYGVPIFGRSGAGPLAAFAIAVVLGLALFVNVELVVASAAFVIAATSIALETQGLTCSTDPGHTATVLLASYTVGYGVCVAIRLRRTR